MQKILISLFSLLLLSCQTPMWKTLTDPSYRLEKKFLQKEVSVAVILGPGGAKTFSHIGAMKALLDENVKIEAVVGLGGASLFGSIFAHKKNLSSLRWAIYKLFRKYSFSSESPFDYDFLKAHLPTLFSELKIPFICPSYSYHKQSLNWEDKGIVKAAVRRCLNLPPFLSSKKATGLATPLKQAVTYLRDKGHKKIIFINVLPYKVLNKSLKAKNLSLIALWNHIQFDLNSQLKELEEDSSFRSIEVKTYFDVLSYKKYRFFIEQGENQVKSVLPQILKNF